MGLDDSELSVVAQALYTSFRRLFHSLMQSEDASQEERQSYPRINAQFLALPLLEETKKRQVLRDPTFNEVHHPGRPSLNSEFMSFVYAFVDGYDLDIEQLEVLVIELQKYRNSFYFYKKLAQTRVKIHTILERISSFFFSASHNPEHAAIAWEAECCCEDVDVLLRILDGIVLERS